LCFAPAEFHQGYFCIRCRISTKALESQTVAAFSPGLRDDLVFRARSSGGKLSAQLLRLRRVCHAPHHQRPVCSPGTPSKACWLAPARQQPRTLQRPLQRRARRGHVITQHGLIATRPLNRSQMRRTAHEGSTAAKPRLTPHHCQSAAPTHATPEIRQLKDSLVTVSVVPVC